MASQRTAQDALTASWEWSRDKKRTSWKDDVAKMNEALRKENVDAAIIEIYSPPRVNAIANMWNLLPGWSLDLMVNDPEDNKPWDFNDSAKRDKAEDLVDRGAGLLLIWVAHVQCF